jgi:methanogenesis imperfect marker protein 11
MLTGVKLRLYESLGKKEFFRRMALKKEFKAFMMVDPSGQVIEAANYWANWVSGLASGASSFLFKNGGVGGYDKLVYPDSETVYGNLHSTQYKPGKVDAELVPSFVPLAVTGVEVKNGSVVFSERGIGGGPDLIRLLAGTGKRYVETPLKGGGVSFDIEYPIYRKVVISLDDTDSSVKGATFSTALQISSILSRALKGVQFLRMTISLNWPQNPVKTTNNASSALVFAVEPGKEEELVREFTRLATKATISKETGMAVMDKVRAPEQLKAYSMKVKSVQVDVSETYKVAEQTGVKTIPITGERGLIGAVSAIGLVDDPGRAVTPIGVGGKINSRMP